MPDYDEYSHGESSFNSEAKASEEVEFVVQRLNYIAGAAGRYSRSVQLPNAIHIVNTLKEMNSSKDERLPSISERINIIKECIKENIDYSFAEQYGIADFEGASEKMNKLSKESECYQKLLKLINNL
jgi:hypothetical protein